PVEDGFYSTATVRLGKRRASFVGNNALPSGLRVLLEGLAANVHSARAQHIVLHQIRGPPARLADAPPTAPCPEGESATRYVRELLLQEAARLGLAKLTAKGGFGTDDVAVDLDYKDVAAPTVVRLNIELVSETPDIETEFAKVVSDRFKDLKIDSGPLQGQPVRIELNVIRRDPSSAPRPCYHQLLVSDDPNLRDYVTGVGPSVQGGEISASNNRAWAHEVLHLAGLVDRYQDAFVVNGQKIPLGERGLSGQALADRLAKLGLKMSDGHLESIPDPGYE